MDLQSAEHVTGLAAPWVNDVAAARDKRLVLTVMVVAQVQATVERDDNLKGRISDVIAR